MFSSQRADVESINIDIFMLKLIELFDFRNTTGCSIEYSIVKGLKCIDFNEIHLSLVFKNLIDNSLEAREGKDINININWYTKNDKTIIDYSDDGPGIAKDIEGDVFSHFFTTKKSGSGIGLSLVRNVLEKNDGTISLISSPKGAFFRLELKNKIRE